MINKLDSPLLTNLRVCFQAKLRSSSWWTRYFVQTGLTENEGPLKKFEEAASKDDYKPDCQIFHLSS
jgi:putative pectin methylesterase